MARKFIIENTTLKMGEVEMHFELASNRSNVKGGGYFYIDREKKTLYLYGKSIDFGKVTTEELTKAWVSTDYPRSINNFVWEFYDTDSLEECFNRHPLTIINLRN